MLKNSVSSKSVYLMKMLTFQLDGLAIVKPAYLHSIEVAEVDRLQVISIN